MTLNVRTVAQALGGDVTGPDSVSAPGPGHDSPQDRSLSIKLSPDAPDGFTVYSHAGDDWRVCRDHVAMKLGLPTWEPKTKKTAEAPRQDHSRRKVAEYIYRLADGTPYVRVDRYENPKSFPQWHWTGSGWGKGKPKGSKVPYRLPEILAAPEAPVLIVEGEKDADNLARLGVVATTSSEGAGKWTADLGQWFEGRTVYILPDNDDNGRKHAHQVAENLHGIAADIRMVDMLVLPEKGDVSDWLAAGGTVEDLLRICESALRWSPREKAEQPKPEHADNADSLVTEDNAAMRFAEVHVGRLRYCWDTGAWFTWTGHGWHEDRTGRAFQWARELARRLSRTEPDKVRFVSSKTSFAAGVERFARSDPAFAVKIDAWDQDPFLMGTPEGTVDLRTGTLRRSDPAEGITKAAAVAPAKTADCPRWLRFLEEATAGDGEIVRFLQQWCGYSLTGDTREHALLFGYGAGGNGKSVFINTVAGILNDYAVTAGMETFTAAAGDRHPTDLAMLRGARMVTASETEEGRAWAEVRIKSLTGGDKITARFMRQDFFTYTPTFKITVIGNHRPALRNVDEAARRRFNIVPFVHQPQNPDPTLEAKLKAEWPGILRWMIDGCLDWQTHGLVRPESVKAATREYFSGEDLIGQWLEDECDIRPGDHSWFELSPALFGAWTAYAAKVGEQAGNQKAFAENLKRRGLEPFKSFAGRGFRGVRFKPQRRRPGE